MHDAPRVPALARSGLKLQQTPRVGSDDDVRSGRRDVRGLAEAELGGHVRLDEVEDAGAAAADLGLGQRNDRDVRNGGQEPARLLPHSLSVCEVAGVVVRDAEWQPTTRRPRWSEAIQRFGQIADLGGKRPCPRGPLGVVLQQLAVVLERRAAAGRVDHNLVDVRTFEGGNEASGMLSGVLVLPGMERQRPAAALRGRRIDGATLGGQHAHRALVHVAEEHLLHAARHETDAQTLFARGGRVRGHSAHDRPCGRDNDEPAESRRETREEPG